MIKPDRKISYADLGGIPGHKNFYRNPLSRIIHFKRGKFKFSTGVTQITKAKEIAEIRMAEMKTPGSAKTVKRRLAGVHNPLLKDLWEDDFLEMKRSEVTDSTMKTYDKNWEYGLKGFWGTKTAIEATDDNVAAFKVWSLENNPKRHSVKTVIHLNAFFKFLFSRRIIRELPDMSPLKGIAEIVNRNAKREKVGRVYTEIEVRAMIDACDTFYREDLGRRARLGILFGVYAGLRKNEALRIKLENIDLKKRIVRIWSQKNNKWRTVPLVDELYELIKLAHATANGSEWLFPMPSDPTRPLSPQNFDKVWIQAKEIAKIQGRARFHDLRHTFATRTAEDGWPPVVACEVLDMSLTIYQRIYCKPSPEKISAMMMRTFNRRPEK